MDRGRDGVELPTRKKVKKRDRGARVSSFFWIQCMVRDDGARTLLFDLDNVTQRIGAERVYSPNAIRLTGIYHNLLRRWAEVQCCNLFRHQICGSRLISMRRTTMVAPCLGKGPHRNGSRFFNIDSFSMNSLGDLGISKKRFA
jgi:hypothetical protein